MDRNSDEDLGLIRKMMASESEVELSSDRIGDDLDRRVDYKSILRTNIK